MNTDTEVKLEFPPAEKVVAEVRKLAAANPEYVYSSVVIRYGPACLYVANGELLN